MRYLVVLFFIVVSCKPGAQETGPASESSAPALPKTDALFKVGPYTNPVPTPRSGDWLAQHKELGQTFKSFFYSAERHTPDDKRNTIYLRPVGEQPDWGPGAPELSAFIATFFQMRVDVLPPLPTDKIVSREHGPWKTQLLTGSILDELEKEVPEDAFCVLAYTMHDLYPADDWNFVYGEATFERRVGVFSIIRHVLQEPNNLAERDAMLLHSFKILSHEIGHMFGIKHCIAHHCGMNGINNGRESRRAPLNYCPVCQQKLHHAVGYDVFDRNRQLEQILQPISPEAASYYRNRTDWLESQVER